MDRVTLFVQFWFKFTNKVHFKNQTVELTLTTFFKNLEIAEDEHKKDPETRGNEVRIPLDRKQKRQSKLDCLSFEMLTSMVVIYVEITFLRKDTDRFTNIKLPSF